MILRKIQILRSSPLVIHHFHHPPWMTTSQDAGAPPGACQVEFAALEGAAPPFRPPAFAVQPWPATRRPPSTLPLCAELRYMVYIPGPLT